MLGKSSSKRTNILKILFKFLDTDNDQIKIKLSRIILAVNIVFYEYIFVSFWYFFKFEVGTNNLTNICRLLFSLTRKEENDPLFLQDNLLGNYHFWIDLLIHSYDYFFQIYFWIHPNV